MKSPDFSHFIILPWTVLYRNHLIPDWQGSATNQIQKNLWFWFVSNDSNLRFWCVYISNTYKIRESAPKTIIILMTFLLIWVTFQYKESVNNLMIVTFKEWPTLTNFKSLIYRSISSLSCSNSCSLLQSKSESDYIICGSRKIFT